MDSHDPARTRFAPSPTGTLHVGGVRTALYCMLQARRTQGQYILRIEDTDRARSTEAAEAGILGDLQWCGLEGDEGPTVAGSPKGPYRQSERRDLYRKYADQLLEQGHAYRAWESSEELTAMRKEAEAAKQNFRYRERVYSDAEVARFEAEGRTPVIRFRASREPVTIVDEVLGEVTAEPEVLDDFVIVKADGWPTYHFAVVVDDHHMEVTLVMRGQEHLMNTHKHVQLYAAFGWTPPAHAHLPLIHNPNGGKMSKRDKARAAREGARRVHKELEQPKGEWGWLVERTGLPGEEVAVFMGKRSDAVDTVEAIAEGLGLALPMIEVLDFRRAGFLPEALVNYMALLGWSPGDDREIMSVAEMVEAFSVDRITKTPARFDLEKLQWVNAQYMQQLPTEQLLVRMDQWLEVAESPIRELDEAARVALLGMYRSRARTFREIEERGPFLFDAPAGWAPKAVKKHLEKGDGWIRLEQARGALDDVGRWEAPSLMTAFEALSEGTGVPLGKYAQPVRVAVTGTGVSAEIMDTLAFLGREACLERIDRCLDTRPSEAPSQA